MSIVTYIPVQHQHMYRYPATTVPACTYPVTGCRDPQEHYVAVPGYYSTAPGTGMYIPVPGYRLPLPVSAAGNRYQVTGTTGPAFLGLSSVRKLLEQKGTRETEIRGILSKKWSEQQGYVRGTYR
jgi:hypothetical protein